MARARLYHTLVLLLYSQVSYGQQALPNNPNIGGNNAIGLQQQAVQRMPSNINQIPNGGLNINLAQQPNLQQANLQSTLSGQGNSQQVFNLPPNLQSQIGSQNAFQITKMGFTPVAPGSASNAPSSTQQMQNSGNPNLQVVQPQNIPITNGPISMSTLAELAALKGQPSLLSLLNPQNTGQSQQNQQFVPNTIPTQNQLTDVQKQMLVRSLQGQNQQGVNYVQAQPRVTSLDNQQITVRTLQGNQQAPAVVTLGNQPAYITVQAQPLATYLQNQTPTAVVEEEPSILSLIMSELGPQYATNVPLPKKGSKTNLKSLIPLIINLLKEKNCGCRNCECPNNSCPNNSCPSMMTPEAQMAQIFGGYSNQKMYGQDSEDNSARIKKNDDEELRKNDKDKKKHKKKEEIIESEELSEEDDSEYIDDGDD